MGQCLTGNLFMNDSDEGFKALLKGLSDKQLKDLKSSWHVCLEQTAIGEKILLSLVRNQPLFATYFGIEPRFSVEKIKSLASFAGQAIRIQGFMDNLVLSLAFASEKTLEDMCHHVGKIHFYHGVNLAEEHWLYFQFVALREIMQCNSGIGKHVGKELGQLRLPWLQLFGVVTREIRNGFVAEALDNFKNQAVPLDLPRPYEIEQKLPLFAQVYRPTLDTNGDILIFNQIQCCRQSWNQAKENDIGLSILIQMILSKPDFARPFGVEQGIPGDEIAANTSVKMQGKRIQAFLDTVICLYGILPEDKLEQMCQRIGGLHFRQGINFTTDCWLLFKRVTLEQVTLATKQTVKRKSSAGENSEFLAAWDKLICFIIEEMKKGFMEKAKVQNRAQITRRRSVFRM